jgi:hypothetical protein
VTVTLDFQPVRDGYQFTPAYDVVETRLDGGMLRKRKDVEWGCHYVDLNWVLRPEQYTQFMGFFRTTLEDGTLPFLLDLLADIHTPTTHKCRCVGGLPKLTSQRGHAYYVGARLEVEQNPTFSGQLLYAWSSGGTLPTVQFLADDMSAYLLNGDTVRIFNATGTHADGPVDLDLDGTYEVTGSIGATFINIADADTVNSDWTILQGLTPDTFVPSFSTITRVPT